MGTRKVALGLVLAAIALSLVGCGEPPPELSNEVKAAVTASIRAYVEVVDADITQQGRKLRLALTIVAGKNQQQARELGESYVRLVKLIGPETPPEVQVGEGLYDYAVSVTDVDGRLLAEGAKRRSGADMSW